MSEEEKKAIDYYINNEYSFGFETDMDIESFKKAIGIEETDEDTWEKHQIRFKTLLNLIEKQQKELEQEKEKNKELEATLKQTQDSWYEDTKKIELNNECEIALNNRIIDLENELNKEKEKNKKIEEYCRKDLAFEKRLERQNEKPDDYNRGVFNTCFNILELLEERN